MVKFICLYIFFLFLSFIYFNVEIYILKLYYNEIYFFVILRDRFFMLYKLFVDIILKCKCMDVFFFYFIYKNE